MSSAELGVSMPLTESKKDSLTMISEERISVGEIVEFSSDGVQRTRNLEIVVTPY